MERVFLNINQTNRELNRKIKQYLKQKTVRGQVRDLRVLTRALTDVTLLVPVAVSDPDRRTSSSGYTYVIAPLMCNDNRVTQYVMMDATWCCIRIWLKVALGIANPIRCKFKCRLFCRN